MIFFDPHHIFLHTIAHDAKASRLTTITVKKYFLKHDKEVAKNGLSAIETEMKRALEQIETDPMASALYAANILEASCKAYLDHYAISYKKQLAHFPLYGNTLRNMLRFVQKM